MNLQIPRWIFREYDIRGQFGRDLHPDTLQNIGIATGYAVEQELEDTQFLIVVGHDLRNTSEVLAQSFMTGVQCVGISPAYLGASSLGQSLFYTWQQNTEDTKTILAYITASHLPASWNGLKFFWGDGTAFSREMNFRIRDIMEGIQMEKYESLQAHEGNGNQMQLESSKYNLRWDVIGRVNDLCSSHFRDDYEDYLSFSFLSVLDERLHLFVDCGGGASTKSAPSLLKRMEISADFLFDKPDPSFSGRPSEPSEENLKMLIDRVRNYSANDQIYFGVAFDGDGDRAAIITPRGKYVSSEQLAILHLKYNLELSPGDLIIANLDASMILDDFAEARDLKIERVPVGHTFILKAVQERKAKIGIESSGHIVFPEHLPFDDAMVIPLVTAQFLSSQQKTLDELIEEVESYPIVRMKVNCDNDSQKFQILERIVKELNEGKIDVSDNSFVSSLDAKEKGGEVEINLIDGIHIRYSDMWLLIRASNTSPKIRITVEGRDQAAIDHLSKSARSKVLEIKQGLSNND